MSNANNLSAIREEDQQAPSSEQKVSVSGEGESEEVEELDIEEAIGMCLVADGGEVRLLVFLTIVLHPLWDLSEIQAASIFSSLFAGQVIGTLLIPPLSDRYGRKPMYVLSATIVTVFGFLTAASQSYTMLIVCRLLVGTGIGGSVVPYDTLSEFLPCNVRGTYLVCMAFFWAIGELLVLGIARATLGTEGYADDESGESKDWRIFTALVAIPVLIALLLGVFRVPESPRWLLSKRNPGKALTILRHVAKRNGKNPDETFSNNIILVDRSSRKIDSDEHHENGSPLDLFKTKNGMLRITLLLWIAWFGSNFSGSALGLLTGKFSSSISSRASVEEDHPNLLYTLEYIPLVVGNIASLAGPGLVLMVVKRFGRVPIQVVSFTIAGLASLGYILLGSNHQGSGAFALVLQFVARISYMSGSATIWMHTAELIPTALRATGHGLSSLVARLGGFASPYMVESPINNTTSAAIIVAAVALITAASVIGQPETKGKPLDFDDNSIAPASNEDDTTATADELDAADIEQPSP